MKLYKTKAGLIIQAENNFYQVNQDWDYFINDGRRSG